MMRTRRDGFTLVELLIVIIILGVLAAIVIPQFRSSADETKEAALLSDLQPLRAAIELFFIQHDSTYPGTINGNSSWGNFVVHMTTQTDENGDPGTRFGPYLRRNIPRNPLNNLNTGIVGPIPQAPDDSSGWYYNPTSGELRTNSPGAGPTTGLDYFDM